MTTFGLQLPDFGWITAEPAEAMARTRALAEAAEAGGFRSLWVMDHFLQLPPLGGPTRPILEGYTLLGALAAVTSSVELGTLVTGVTYRNPAILAKQVTTLDVLSGGRAILGIGAAWYDVEHTAYHVDFPPVKQRFELLEEAVQICSAMFREEAPSFAGSHYGITEARNVPRPVRAEGIPIMIGGSGPQKTLRLVARYADLCNISGPPERLRELNAILDGHCATEGRDPKAVSRTSLTTVFLCDSAQEADSTRSMLQSLLGDDPRIAGMVVGTDDEVVAQVGAIVEAGIDQPIVNVPLVQDPQKVVRVGELLTGALS